MGVINAYLFLAFLHAERFPDSLKTTASFCLLPMVQSRFALLIKHRLCHL